MNRLTSVLGVLVLLVTTSLHAQLTKVDSWSGFDLNKLREISTNVFELLDADKNGSITLDEIDLVNAELDENPSEEDQSLHRRRLNLVNSYFWTEEEVDAFKVGDTNNDDTMDRREFDNLETNIRTEVLKLGIQLLDNDRNGSVEANEFSAHFDSFGDWDTDGSGTLDSRELAKISDRRLFTDLRRRWSGQEQSNEERNRIAIELEARAAEQERRDKQAQEQARRAMEQERSKRDNAK